MLFIDQPIGAGLSTVVGNSSGEVIPYYIYFDFRFCLLIALKLQCLLLSNS